MIEALEDLLRQIPLGRCTTFGRLARALGDVGAARWVAQAVREGGVSADCPTHRVVMKSGEPGGRHAERQLQSLQAEGVALLGDRVDFGEGEFTDFYSTEPLLALKHRQEQLPRQIKLRPFPDTPVHIAGVDVSYLKDGSAVACYVLLETFGGKLVNHHTIRRQVQFPYISGYLAFRELPILLDLLDEVRAVGKLADVIFVDGNGLLHPRRSGIASHLGVLADVRTVGVGKKLLCGRVDLSQVTLSRPQPIRDGDDIIGIAMKSAEHSRPVFVSPGHQIDVGDAFRLTRQLFRDHRVPEPIYHADALSRAEAKSIMAQDSKVDPLRSRPESP